MDGAERQNAYAGCVLDRAATRRRDEAWLAARLADPATRLLPVWRGHNLIVGLDPPTPALLRNGEAQALLDRACGIALLGVAEDTAHFVVDLSHLDDPGPALPERAGEFAELRAVGPLLGQPEGALLAYARGLMHWHARSRFCSVCGSPTESLEAGHLRRCSDTACGALHHPRTDPAVIMLVTDGERAILGRQRSWPAGMHSVLAGFVEPGESLEEAVRREVMEEVGIECDAVHYHSSQPWPFPASIMLGFTAHARTTALRIATDELENARWFTRDELRNSPEDERLRLSRRDSIARRLVDDWLAGEA